MVLSLDMAKHILDEYWSKIAIYVTNYHFWQNQQ